MARTVSIQNGLLASVGLLVALLAGAIFALMTVTGNQLLEASSQRVIERALDRAEVEFDAFFGPVTRNLEMSRGWFEAGVLDRADDRALHHFFRPLMDAYPQISSVSLADASGWGWMMMRRPDGWLSRRVDPPSQGHRLHYQLRDDAGETLRDWWIDDPAPEERYDPRTRDWYTVAVEAGRPLEPGLERPKETYWTRPYHFFTTGEPGITGSLHLDAPQGPMLLAFDVLLTDISAFTRGIEITQNGFVGMLSPERRLVGLPRHPALDTSEAISGALLKQPRELGIAIFDDAIAARQEQGLPAFAGVGEQTLFRFESSGERYWSDVRAIAVPPDHHYLVVVNVPERDLTAPFEQLRERVLGVAFVTLLLAIAGTWWLARRYSTPLSSLARNSQRFRHLDLEPAPPIRSSIEEIGQLARAHEGLRGALDAFARYVPTDVVRELLELGEAARIGGTRRSLTVLFSDIEGFTSISERLGPEAVTQHLARYFDALLPILEEDGTVDKLVGDGIMAFWGAPLPDARHARHAVEAVLHCLEVLEELNPQWQAAGESPLPTRFGLASGEALVGNVGSHQRLSYTAVGDVVNLASRLEGLNRLYGTRVLAAAPIPEQAGPGFVWREVDRVRVVGRTQAVSVHEPLGAVGSVPRSRLAFAKRYGKALGLYRKREWAAALAELEPLEPPWSDDASVERLRAACRAALEAPPSPEWEAVTLLDRK